MVAFVGDAQGQFWEDVAKATEAFLGTAETMRCMAYFPVVFRVRHIAAFRAHIAKLHNATFDDAFANMYRNAARRYRLNGRWIDVHAWSQFNVLCNYAFAHHREEYDWHLHPRHGYTGPTQPPLPRLATHGGYTKGIGHLKTDKCCQRARPTNPGCFDLLRETWRGGLCRGYGERCRDGGEADTVQGDLFLFEHNDWCHEAGAQACLEAQRAHYARVHAAGPPKPSEEVVRCVMGADKKQ